MEFNEEFTLPSSMNLGLPFDFITPDIPTNSEYAFSDNNTNKDLIESIQLRQIVLTILDPTDSDFSFLKSVKVYIDAEDLDEVLIASKSDIPDEIGNKLELELENVELQQYIKKDEFKLRVETVTDEVFSPDHKINVYSKFFVDAKLLGV